jgi:hypothetical protein
MVRLTLWVVLACSFSGVVWAEENPAAAKSIGVATMLANGTILIGIGGGPDLDRARAVLMVEPGDTNYQSIVDHVGGLKPGESKPIPPWPDQPTPEPRKNDAEDGTPRGA